jgi:hypothetical protein
MKCRRKGKVKSRDKSEMRRQRVLGGRGTSERGNQWKPTACPFSHFVHPFLMDIAINPISPCTSQ